MPMVVQTILHREVQIHLCEENGRRFWSVSIPDPSGWTMPQEFCSVQDAIRYADEKLARNRAYRLR